MALLKVFLTMLVESFPDLFDTVKQVLHTMMEHGHFTEETKQKLIRSIKPSRHKEIDENIDKEVAARFQSESSEEKDDEGSA
jgi:hypothetical protein